MWRLARALLRTVISSPCRAQINGARQRCADSPDHERRSEELLALAELDDFRRANIAPNNQFCRSWGTWPRAGFHMDRPRGCWSLGAHPSWAEPKDLPLF